jgi:hypothetical protein
MSDVEIKIFTCDRCKPFGGEQCVLKCDNIQNPTHCPCTDSMKPYAEWIEQPKEKS